MASCKYFINENELECSICLELWIKKDPRVLSCQHTFCSSCLARIVKNNKVQCPLCRLKTAVPKNGVKDLPKNIFRHSLQTVNINNQIIEKCFKHKRNIVYPKLACITCKVKDLCEICIEDDHSYSECKVKSYKRLSTNLKEFWETSKTRLDQIYMDLKKEVSEFMKSIMDMEELWLYTIDKRIKELKRKVKNYEEKKLYNLKQILEKVGNIFINESQIKEDIENLSKTRLISNNSSKIYSNYDINEQKHEGDFLLSKYSAIGSYYNILQPFCFTNEGLYEIIKDDEKNHYLTIRNDKSNDNQFMKKFTLNKDLSDFVITEKKIYGLERKTGNLYLSDKPFKKDIHLEKLVNDLKFTSFTVNEDERVTNTYLLGLNRSDDNYPSVLHFFKNDKLNWKKNFRKRFYNLCILSNGDSLALTGCEIYKLHKDNGNILDRVWLKNSPCITINPLPIRGFLLVDLHNKCIIKQYDNCLTNIHQFSIGIQPIYIKITTSGILFAQELNHDNRTVIYKID